MDDDEIEYVFLDPFVLLQGLVANSPDVNVRLALLNVIENLTGAEEEHQVAASDVLESLTHILLWQHVCSPECQRQAEEDHIVEKFREEIERKTRGGNNE